MEELTDARLRCDQLKKQVDQAVRLISKSTHRDHFYEIAGDLIFGIPDTLFKLDKALDATALAASRLDYEELKQELKPEKVEELERVLKDVRIRHVDRRSGPLPLTGKQARSQSMFKLASTNKISSALRKLADYVDQTPAPNRHVVIAGLHRIKMGLALTAEEAVEAMGPIEADSREDVMDGFKGENPDLSEQELEDIADKWEEHKDTIKDKNKNAASGEKKKFLVTAWVEMYTHVDANSPEEAVRLSKSRSAKWSRTMNLPPRDLKAEEYIPE